MVTADRPASMQAQGYIALAHLALATGRWREAMQALDSAAPRNPVAAAWTRAYFLSMPFVRASADDVTRAEQALTAVSELRAPAPLYLQIGVALPAASVIRPYLTELLQRGPRDAEGSTSSEVDLAVGALQCPRGAAEPGVMALCADLELALLAESAGRRGRFDEALARLEAMQLQVPYQYAARSQFHARSRERFMLAALLERQGRDAEAGEHYEALPHGAWADYVFLAPAYLGRARIRERRGDRTGAAMLYKRVLTLWGDPDPELAAVHRDARAGLARVTAAP
jgi:tetratricopeptide (TPR) repeat protein